MCLICVHFEQDKLTNQEAWSNLSEMRVALGEEHAEEVEKMIIDAEVKTIKIDLEKLLKELDDEPFDFNFGIYDYFGIGEEE